MNDYLKEVLASLNNKLEENKDTISRLQVENTNLVQSIEQLKNIR